jgi:hypothetical protein
MGGEGKAQCNGGVVAGQDDPFGSWHEVVPVLVRSLARG